MALPPSLLAKLTLEDARSFDLATAAAPTSDLTAHVKEAAERRLLALTPEAVSTLGDVLSSGENRERLKAAEMILDRSPATTTLKTAAPTAPSLPIEAFRLLVDGMVTLFGPGAPSAGPGPAGAVLATSSPLTAAPDQEVIDAS